MAVQTVACCFHEPYNCAKPKYSSKKTGGETDQLGKRSHEVVFHTYTEEYECPGNTFLYLHVNGCDVWCNLTSSLQVKTVHFDWTEEE